MCLLGERISLIHQSIPPAPSPSPGYCGAFARLVSTGGGAFANFSRPGGRAFANPGGQSRAFKHARGFLSECNYTEGFTGKKKQIGSSVKDRNKLKRVVKVCSRFYACISSLLIKPKLLHSEIGAFDANQCFLVIESNFC